MAINDRAEYYPKGSAIETSLIKYLHDNGVDVNAKLNERNLVAKTLA